MTPGVFRQAVVDPDFIPCTEVSLSEPFQLAAAETAVRENPNNAPALALMALIGVIPPPLHIAVLTTRYWRTNGVRLTVGFMETIQTDLRERLLSHFNAWGEFSNVSFSFSQTDPQVRVTRGGQGYWSYVGTDILQIPRHQPTMCLQGFTMETSEKEFRRVVRHEVGHTLGCPHEHMRSDIVNRLDQQKTIKYFQQTQGWSAAMTQQQVLTPLNESSLMGTPAADVTSIMTYALPGIITKDGQPIPGGNDFAPQDREFFAKLYPKAVVPPVEPPIVPPGPPVVKKYGIFLDFENKVAAANLPAGWALVKAQQAEEPNTMAPTKEQMLELHYELGQAIPLAGTYTLPEGAEGIAFGGLIAKIVELSTALQAGNWKAALKAVRDLLNIIIDDNGGTIQFAPGSPSAAIDWKRVGSVLMKLLPFLLELLAKQSQAAPECAPS